MLGPLTTSWIQKHHQEEAKTLARTPPYPAKGRDKLEESLKVQRSKGSTSFHKHQLLNTRQQEGLYSPSLTLNFSYKFKKQQAILGRNQIPKTAHKRLEATVA